MINVKLFFILKDVDIKCNDVIINSSSLFIKFDVKHTDSSIMKAQLSFHFRYFFRQIIDSNLIKELVLTNL